MFSSAAGTRTDNTSVQSQTRYQLSHPGSPDLMMLQRPIMLQRPNVYDGLVYWGLTPQGHIKGVKWWWWWNQFSGGGNWNTPNVYEDWRVEEEVFIHLHPDWPAWVGKHESMWLTTRREAHGEVWGRGIQYYSIITKFFCNIGCNLGGGGDQMRATFSCIVITRASHLSRHRTLTQVCPRYQSYLDTITFPVPHVNGKSILKLSQKTTGWILIAISYRKFRCLQLINITSHHWPNG